MIPQIPKDFLPGCIRLTPGRAADYRTLERFHYLPTRPATWAAVVCAHYHAPQADLPQPLPPRLVGVAVLSWPPALHQGRNRAFGLKRLRYGLRIQWANQNIRTISRVVVHPQFRSIGIAHALIDWICNYCTTEYIEASARMGRAHPMFERAGFQRVDPPDDVHPIYYWRKTKIDKTNPIPAELPAGA